MNIVVEKNVILYDQSYTWEGCLLERGRNGGGGGGGFLK